MDIEDNEDCNYDWLRVKMLDLLSLLGDSVANKILRDVDN
jgi:hypothetical protein